MVDAAQVRDLILRFASGQLKAEEFRRQFALFSHNIHKCQDAEALRLCNLVEARIADVLSDHLSSNEFKSALAREVFQRPAETSMVMMFNVSVSTSEQSSVPTTAVPLFFSGGSAPRLGIVDTSIPPLPLIHA
jgi:hypothetical protein